MSFVPFGRSGRYGVFFPGCFDIRGSPVALFVPKIWPTRFFLTEEQEQEQELAIEVDENFNDDYDDNDDMMTN